ncbi:hypothetical protein LPJ78_004721 [Coemansia sp. RSA 989]|nr:hypothetical protein BX667DRAFT_339374 [Coemansia mojavensis]KAJ1739846.1 hypothetical protein LPJ68_004322 [Coemansia sp. RSA 1086]KAJ1746957.1 hypothetical protein LPJ79_005580 [Coemansia sp. RSA 1821]KAJ1862449.1 hypothetical protein LPJ78_004721 [Coemansia sp. RSA 989]KAJ1870257.1 hypothetical protein LPJ55_004787 [Coemansia sp. RSA 990]KAJ2632979.1 hypothetical protein H4R22_000836 [Coemansia sp. RSA 1290]KAJ2647090.1 hypothetical protein IWW40_004946 [Coemansia sp. RSA 1250]KAJ26689
MKVTFAVGASSLVLLLAQLCKGAGTLNQVTTAQLDRAIPKRAGSNGCASAAEQAECATNEVAAAAITNAINKYDVKRRGEVVALIALMAYESADWEYNINHFPGRAGQGTRAMLMYNFISTYAQSLYPSRVTTTEASSQSTQVMNSVRELVLNNDDSFAAAFWYLTTVAKDYYGNESRLRSGNIDDFKAYIENGVHTSWNEQRSSVWKAVDAALV